MTRPARRKHTPYTLRPWRVSAAGDRLALLRFRATGSDELEHSGTLPGAGAFETETLEVVEVDGDGRFLATVVFDPGDRRAASLEMQERFARCDAGRSIPAAAVEAQRAWADHDLDRLRRAVSHDFVLDHHRRAGVGRVEGVDDYIASVAAIFEQTPDEFIEPLYLIAVEKHGALAMLRAFGTLTDGGEFEIVYVGLARYRDDRYVALELFEPEDLELARARFEELRPQPASEPPDPLRIPERGRPATRSRASLSC